MVVGEESTRWGVDEVKNGLAGALSREAPQGERLWKEEAPTFEPPGKETKDLPSQRWENPIG